MSFYETETFTLIVLPVLIFLARVCDVTIGTLRLVSVSRGHKILAPLFGFFEVLIWIVVISKVISNLNNWICYVAYAGGFAAGNFVGIIIEEKMAMGTFIIRVITQKDGTELVNQLNTGNYGATSIKAEGSKGDVDVIYSVIKRSDMKDVLDMVKKFNPNAFYTIEDVRFVKKGVFPETKKTPALKGFRLTKLHRKGK